MLKIDIKKELIGYTGKTHLDINCEIKEGEFVGLIGDSGSGKSTFLRILAGLEECDGFISNNDEVWKDEKILLKPQKRNIGYVFQNYTLFENKNVEKNLLFVNNDKKLANKLLKIVNMQNLKTRDVKTLSGGQKQRIALCMAFIGKPKLMLLDEPLSGVDSSMRKKLYAQMKKLHKEMNTTIIIASHNISEVYKISQRIINIHLGKITEDILKEDFIKQANKEISFCAEVVRRDEKNTYLILNPTDEKLVKIPIDNNLSLGDTITLSISNDFFTQKTLLN